MQFDIDQTRKTPLFQELADSTRLKSNKGGKRNLHIRKSKNKDIYQGESIHNSYTL